MRHQKRIHTFILMKYNKPQTSYWINCDEELKPIEINIPKVIEKVYRFRNPDAKEISVLKPPPELIDNYGLAAAEQYFNRRTIPKRLLKLQKDKDGKSDDIWRVLVAHKENWKEEIKFIEREWYHCLYGYWVYINGTPTWISPWHYQYLTYATGSYETIDRKTGKLTSSLYPEYRDVDRRKFIAYHYFYTLTETFEKLDKDGNAIPEPDGTYKMIDTGRRLCFGVVRPKHRRAGETVGCLTTLYFQTIQLAGPQGYSSICANHENTVKKHWNEKFIPMWRKMPFWFKPITNASTRPKREITFKSPGGKQTAVKFGKDVSTETIELDTTIDFADIVSASYYDHAKITGILLSDEGGKRIHNDVFEDWNIIKPTMSQGAGSTINPEAFSFHPSTVEELESGGGANYKQLCDGSKYYTRGRTTGQTSTGLVEVYFSATDGLENFVGPYGESIIDDPTPEQAKFIGRTIGAREFIESEIQRLESNPTIDNLKKLAKFRRQHPPCYADIWRSIAGEIGFNAKKMDLRQDELRRLDSLGQSKRVKGNFMWIIEGYPPMTAEKFWDMRLQEYDLPKAWVDFVPSPDGRFYVSKVLPTGSHNRVKLNPDTDHYEVVDDIYHASADPVMYQTKNQAKGREDKSGASSAAGTVFYPFQESIDEGKIVSEWETHKFICTYKNKPQSDDIYAEEMLMMCRYFGCMMFPETNVNLIVKHFEIRGYGGLLRYAWLADRGKYRDTPGFHTGGQQPKDEIISEIRDYIEYYVGNEDHLELIEEWRKMKSKEDMTKFDLVPSSGGSLISYKYMPKVLSMRKWEGEEDEEDADAEYYYGKQR